jgi:hypothetical protein
MSELSNSAYNPSALAGLSQAAEAAKEIIAANNATANKPGHNTPTTLGAIATEAVQASGAIYEVNEIIEQYKKIELQEKILTLGWEAMSVMRDNHPEKNDRIAKYIKRFVIERIPNSPHQLGIFFYYHGQQATSIRFTFAPKDGTLVIPKELQVQELHCTLGCDTIFTELPTTLKQLNCYGGYKVTLPKTEPGSTHFKLHESYYDDRQTIKLRERGLNV